MSPPDENALLVIFSADICPVFGCEEDIHGMGAPEIANSLTGNKKIPALACICWKENIT